LVRLELWNGARTQREGAVLRDLERALPELKIDDDVWAAPFDLARRARAKEIAAPATDIFIAACALHRPTQALQEYSPCQRIRNWSGPFVTIAIDGRSGPAAFS
jgi:predicted nucleic acid-binding protein